MMMFAIVFQIVLLSIVNPFLLDDVTRTVTTPVGDIVGTVEDVPINSTFHYRVQTYRSIPYAEAPTGSLRFKKPVPKAAFKTAFDARQSGFSCFQPVNNPQFVPQQPMSEDCLILNIYVPGEGEDPQDRLNLKPVMIWIHGGGFVIGESYFYEGGVLSAVGGLIVVTINYRLAQYGFLSTGDAFLPGNLGLWDQHLAIKWVHDNIQAFGGDTSRVTIFGESAGSASVVYQTFYPGNKGLFQKAIAESGSMASNWAYTSPEKIRDISLKFAEEVGCNDTDSAVLSHCLSSVPIELINKTVQTPTRMTPVFDNDFVLDHQENLITGKTNASAAIKMFQSVDLMIGFNSGDGLVEIGQWMNDSNTTDINNLTINKDLFENKLVPNYLRKYYHIHNVSDAAVMETVHMYTDWSDPSDDLKRMYKVIDIATDTAFAIPAIRTANLHNHGAMGTYIYEFSARPIKHGLPVPTAVDAPNVANHGDDLFYVFGFRVTNMSESQTLSKEYRTLKATMTLWTNFAKSGNPNIPEDVTQLVNITWPSYKVNEEYLDINLEMDQNSVRTRPRPSAVNLWNQLLPKMLD